MKKSEELETIEIGSFKIFEVKSGSCIQNEYDRLSSLRSYIRAKYYNPKDMRFSIIKDYKNNCVIVKRVS